MQLRAGAPPQRIETTVSTMANVLQNVGVDSARRTQAMSIDELVTPGTGGTAVEREVPEKGGSHLNRGSIYRGNVRAPSNAFPCLFHRVAGEPSQAEGRISRAIESELPVYERRVRLHLMFVGLDSGGFADSARSLVCPNASNLGTPNHIPPRPAVPCSRFSSRGRLPFSAPSSPAALDPQLASRGPHSTLPSPSHPLAPLPPRLLSKSAHLVIGSFLSTPALWGQTGT